MGMMLEIMMGLMDMEVDKVADMVVDRTGLTDVTLMSERNLLKTTDVTLAIGDTYGDDVRGGNWGGGHGG